MTDTVSQDTRFGRIVAEPAATAGYWNVTPPVGPAYSVRAAEVVPEVARLAKLIGPPKPPTPRALDEGGLTKRQRHIFEYVRRQIVSRGYGPTVREIGREFGIGSPNGVFCHLKALEKKGKITWEPGKSRTLTLTEPRTCPHCGGRLDAPANQDDTV